MWQSGRWPNVGWCYNSCSFSNCCLFLWGVTLLFILCCVQDCEEWEFSCSLPDITFWYISEKSWTSAVHRSGRRSVNVQWTRNFTMSHICILLTDFCCNILDNFKSSDNNQYSKRRRRSWYISTIVAADHLIPPTSPGWITSYPICYFYPVCTVVFMSHRDFTIGLKVLGNIFLMKNCRC